MPKSALLGSTAAPPPNRPADQPKRSHHAFRGTPPPATFSLSALPDDAHLKDLEVAAVLRVSTNTLAAWRGVPGHPLKWTTIPGGFVRYEAGNVKRFRASGKPRTRKPPPAIKTTKIQAQADAAPAPRRRRARPRAAVSAVQEAESGT